MIEKNRFEVVIDPLAGNERVPLAIRCGREITISWIAAHGIIAYAVDFERFVTYDLYRMTGLRSVENTKLDSLSVADAILLTAEDFLANVLKLEPLGDEDSKRG